MDLSTLIESAIDEDLGPGDLTTQTCVDPHATGTGRIYAKQAVVVCGQAAAAEVFYQVAERLDAEVNYLVMLQDGSSAEPGDDLARLAGSLQALLIGERVALNLLMKLSGIATHTRAWVRAAGEPTFRIADTRKTTPCLRTLEKHAVAVGGGHNHRMGLYDGVMIKDNHISAVGGISEAVSRVRARVHHLVRIEVEVCDLIQLEEALAAGADVVLLDNMDDEMLRAAVARARSLRPQTLLEASGNINPERLRRLAGLDLDVVSAGGLIHQARWVDLSMDVE